MDILEKLKEINEEARPSLLKQWLLSAKKDEAQAVKDYRRIIDFLVSKGHKSSDDKFINVLEEIMRDEQDHYRKISDLLNSFKSTEIKKEEEYGKSSNI